MNKLKIVSLDGKTFDEFELPEVFVNSKSHQQAMFDSVLAEHAAMRQGTHKTKTKAEVRGGGKKPWKQKHTGKARQGSIRNPHFVGGGVAFGPTPEKNYTLKVNRQAHKLAYVSALNLLFNKDNVIVLEDNLLLDQSPNSKLIFNLLANLKLDNKKILLAVNENSANLLISARNLKNVIVKEASKVSVRDLINAKHVLIQKESLSKILGGLK